MYFFTRSLLSDNQQPIVTTIIVPDIDPEILNKVVEYIYVGHIHLDSKNMAGNVNLVLSVVSGV